MPQATTYSMQTAPGSRRFRFLNGSALWAAALMMVLAGLPARAIPLLPDLGIAGKFNAFVLEDMQGYHSDVEGRLAVGGNLTLENYSIGQQLPDSRGSRDDLIVGGDAGFQHGRIYSGNAVIGDDNNIHEHNVGFYNGDNPHESSGSARRGSPLDFAAIGEELRDKSELWGAWDPTGTTARNDHGEVRFVGSGTGSVFDVDAADLNAATSVWFDMPRYTTAVINVFGASVNLSNFGFFHTAIHGSQRQMPDNQPGVFRHGGNLTNRILFNFVDAKNITMHGIGFKGSLLAPLADVEFFNGHIDGNFISRSLKAPDLSGLALDADYAEGRTSGQFNNYAFRDVPAPSTVSSLVLGLLLLFCLRARVPVLPQQQRRYPRRP